MFEVLVVLSSWYFNCQGLFVIIKLLFFVFLPSEKNQWTLQTIPIVSFLFICSLSTTTSQSSNAFFLIANFFLLSCFYFSFSLVQLKKKKHFFTLDSLQVFLPLFSAFLLLSLENSSDSFLTSVLLPGQLQIFLKMSNSSFIV